MGFALNRFTGPVDQNLLCSICSCVLEDAVLTPCGHSFCQLCLHTWIQARGAGPPTCPECRGRIAPDQARPILSIRNLIHGMDIHCEHRIRGCRTVLKLDGLNSHLETCGYSPIECAGCGCTVNRCDLAEHHMRCDAIAAALRDEDELLQAAASGSYLNSSGSSASGTSAISIFNLGLSNQNARLSQSKDNIRPPKYRYGTYTELAELACRVATLEVQLKRMKRDLEVAEAKNRKLERELKRTKDELEEKRDITAERTYVEFDPDYEYGFTASSISRLSCLLARFLLRKPSYICRDRVFNAIKRCYDNFSRGGDQYEHDVHMLVATAYATNWFSETQKLHFHLWLQAISRRRQYQHISLAALRDSSSTTTTSP